MKVAGNAILHAPVETVYAALRDPRVLVRTIPGCERLEQLGEDAYAMTVTAGVASVRGTYAGDVRLTDHRAPHGFVLRASGSGAPGTVSADVTVELSPGDNGTTELSYDADAVVGGMIGGVGQRLLAGVAKRTAGEFFTAVDQVLTGEAVEGDGVPGDGVAAVAPAAVGAPLAGTVEPGAVGATRTGTGEVGASARADAGGAGPRVYRAPARRAAAAPPGAEFAAGVVLGAAAALVGALVGGYLARRAARPRRPARRARLGPRPARGR
jgi:carbon monoxide dehydrogenase subunit G